MSVMVSEVYDALIDAGATEAKARAAAEAIPISDQLATKQDIIELKTDIASLKADSKIIKYVFAPAVILLLLKIAFFSS